MSNHDGMTVPSATYNPHEQGTDWPPDAFTRTVIGATPGAAIATPAPNSYASDGNMEAFDALPTRCTARRRTRRVIPGQRER